MSNEDNKNPQTNSVWKFSKAAIEAANKLEKDASKIISSLLPKVVPTLESLTSFVQGEISNTTTTRHVPRLANKQNQNDDNTLNKKEKEELKKVLKAHDDKGNEIQEVRFEDIYPEKENLDLNPRDNEIDQLDYLNIYTPSQEEFPEGKNPSQEEFSEEKNTKPTEYDPEIDRAGELIAQLVRGNIKTKTDFLKLKDSKNKNLIKEANSPSNKESTPTKVNKDGRNTQR